MQANPELNQSPAAAPLIRRSLAYENSDANIVTQDGFELQLHWETLCEASEYFKSLHSLPADPKNSGNIEVPEHSDLFLPFMSYIYYNTFHCACSINSLGL